VADSLLDWLASLPALPTYLVLMALSALENVFPPVPADVAVALGAFLAQRGEISVPLLWLLCWGANTASSATVYLFARRHGASFFREGWGRRLVPPEAIDVLARAYESHGVAGIFVSRFLPGLRAAVTPFAGVVGMPAWRALVPAALASALWYAFLIASGSVFARNWDAVKSFVGRANEVLAIVALAATAALGIYLARRVRASRSP